MATVVHAPDRTAAAIMAGSFVHGLPVPDALRAPGIPLGVNVSRGERIQVYQSLDRHSKSCWYFGRSRVGKTSALLHRFLFLARHGMGAGWLDPHRLTARALPGLLAGIDPARVVYLDFDNPFGVPILYNPPDVPSTRPIEKRTGV